MKKWHAQTTGECDVHRDIYEEGNPKPIAPPIMFDAANALVAAHNGEQVEEATRICNEFALPEVEFVAPIMNATPTPQGQPRSETGCVENTDRELWREREGDYYADSIHVTQSGGIGINVGGTVFVKPLKEWHRLAITRANKARDYDKYLSALSKIRFGAEGNRGNCQDCDAIATIANDALSIPDPKARGEQSAPAAEQERKVIGLDVESPMKRVLRLYLDGQRITSDNIGDVRRSLFVNGASEWNGWVRDLTAERENAAPSPAQEKPVGASTSEIAREIADKIVVNRHVTGVVRDDYNEEATCELIVEILNRYHAAPASPSGEDAIHLPECAKVKMKVVGGKRWVQWEGEERLRYAPNWVWQLVAQAESSSPSEDTKPYYNPSYGDEHLCKCGHSYYRHFDSYDNMRPGGCKYCGCYTFDAAMSSPSVTQTETEIPPSATTQVAQEQQSKETGDAQLVLGALDSLGVALTEHGHQWSDGERAIYERAVEIMKDKVQ